MDVGEGAQALVQIEFDFEEGHLLFDFGVGAGAAVEVFRHVFEYQVQVHFTLLIISHDCLSDGP